VLGFAADLLGKVSRAGAAQAAAASTADTLAIDLPVLGPEIDARGLG